MTATATVSDVRLRPAHCLKSAIEACEPVGLHHVLGNYDKLGRTGRALESP